MDAHNAPSMIILHFCGFVKGFFEKTERGIQFFEKENRTIHIRRKIEIRYAPRAYNQRCHVLPSFFMSFSIAPI